ncbi:MAG: class I tRNA ligase family protein, partial [Chloroflexota bacterium]|nr:class I tRNA ligase family protein [Chloroflexota bacterium]
LRFWNHEVLKKTDAVLETILYELTFAFSPRPNSLFPHPNPLPRGEGTRLPSPRGRGAGGEGGHKATSLPPHPNPLPKGEGTRLPSPCGRGAGGEGVRGEGVGGEGAGGENAWSLADFWIYARLQNLIRDVERLFGNHQYGEAGRQIYDFFWNEFADWYIEIAKLQFDAGGDRAFQTVQMLVHVLDMSLRLLHPFIPFVTEELWQHLKEDCIDCGADFGPKQGWPGALIVAPWPEPCPEQDWESAKVADFELVQNLVRAIRNLRAEKRVKHGRRIPVIFAAGEYAHIIEAQADTISAMAKLDQSRIAIHKTLEEKPEGSVALVVGPVEIYLPLAGLVDIEEERTRLKRSLVETEGQIERLTHLINSPFSEKAPSEVVKKESHKLENYKDTAVKLKSQLEELD